MERRNLIIGISFMLLSVIFFPLKDALVKMSSGHYSPILILWTQFAFTGSVFLTAHLIRQGRGRRMPKKPGMQIVRSVIAVISLGSFYWSIQLIPLAEATAMQFVAPLVVTTLSPYILNEKVSVRRWILVIVGFVGVLIVLRPEFGDARLGYMVGLGSGIFLGLFFIMNRKLSVGETPIASIAYATFFGAIMLTPFALNAWTPPRPEDVLIIVGFLCFALIGQACMFSAFHFSEASILSPYHYVQIVGATVFGYLFFGDFPDRVTLLGIAIIIASGIYIALSEANKLTKKFETY